MELKDKIHRSSKILRNPPYFLKSFEEFPILGPIYKKLKKNKDILDKIMDENTRYCLDDPEDFFSHYLYNSLEPQSKAGGIRGLDYITLDENHILKQKNISFINDEVGILAKTFRGYDLAISPKKILSKVLTTTDDRFIVCNYGQEYYKPWFESSDYYLEFSKIESSNEEDIKKFLTHHGALGFIEFGYSYIHVWKLDRDNCPVGLCEENTGELWFEPLEYFKQEVKIVNEILNYYKKLQKTTDDLKKGGRYDKGRANKEQNLMDTQDTLLIDITSNINPRIEETSVIISGDDHSFIRGWRIKSLFHAIYIIIYENILSGKISICPNCGKPFTKKGKQKYCGLNKNKDNSYSCGSAYRMRECRKKKLAKRPKDIELDNSKPNKLRK